MLLHLPDGHGTLAVQEALVAKMLTLDDHLRRSLTWDQGREMTNHREIAEETGLEIYFCDPHSPWQRGSNENTNRLLRFWFEKGTDLRHHTGEDLQRIAATLNQRPRPTLDFQTPATRLNQLLNAAKPPRVA
jgi:IS30 family transposase